MNPLATSWDGLFATFGFTDEAMQEIDRRADELRTQFPPAEAAALFRARMERLASSPGVPDEEIARLSAGLMALAECDDRVFLDGATRDDLDQAP